VPKSGGYDASHPSDTMVSKTLALDGSVAARHLRCHFHLIWAGVEDKKPWIFCAFFFFFGLRGTRKRIWEHW
jgi:hypothetical protein